jgi:hypothetical protein
MGTSKTTSETIGVGPGVGVKVLVGVDVGLGVLVGMSVPVGVFVDVGVSVGLGVNVDVRVGMGVCVGIDVDTTGEGLCRVIFALLTTTKPEKSCIPTMTTTPTGIINQ